MQFAWVRVMRVSSYYDVMRSDDVGISLLTRAYLKPLFTCFFFFHPLLSRDTGRFNQFRKSMKKKTIFTSRFYRDGIYAYAFLLLPWEYGDLINGFRSIPIGVVSFVDVIIILFSSFTAYQRHMLGFIHFIYFSTISTTVHQNRRSYWQKKDHCPYIRNSKYEKSILFKRNRLHKQWWIYQKVKIILLSTPQRKKKVKATVAGIWIWGLKTKISQLIIHSSIFFSFLSRRGWCTADSIIYRSLP